MDPIESLTQLVAEFLETQPAEVRSLLLRTAVPAIFDHGGAEEPGARTRRNPARPHVGDGDARLALEHAVAGADIDAMTEIGIASWLELMQSGELDALAPLLAGVPEERIERDPRLALALAAVSVQLEPLDRAARRVARVRDVRPPTADGRHRTDAPYLILDLLTARLRGDAVATRDAAERLLGDGVPAFSESLRLRSLIFSIVGTAESWTGDVYQARDHLREALASAEDADSDWLRLIATGFLAEAEAKCSDIPSALNRVRQTLSLANENGWMDSSPVGAAAVVGALIATLQCRFADAEELVRIAELATRRPRDRPERAAIALPRLVLLTAEGRLGDALDEIHRAQAGLRSWPADPMVVDTLRAWEARLLSATGNQHEADEVLKPLPRGPLASATLARFCLDRGQLRKALTEIADARARGGQLFPSIALDLLLVEALALRAGAGASDAGDALERALDIAAPAGLLRPLLSHGPRLALALEDHSRRGPSTAPSSRRRSRCSTPRKRAAPRRRPRSSAVENERCLDTSPRTCRTRTSRRPSSSR